MGLSERQRILVAAVQQGLPLVPHPYREIAARTGLDEADVIETLQQMLGDGTIKRLGVVVSHRECGYDANAMVVWDVPDEQVDEVGEWLGAQPGITLCYRRPRRPPGWPYNLFCMIHGRSREVVRARIHALREGTPLAHIPYAVLFSARRFKQRGARYGFDDATPGGHDA